MSEEVEIAKIRLEKGEGDLLQWWECRLLRHQIVGTYKMVRTWKTRNKPLLDSVKPLETEWKRANLDKFYWKVFDKLHNKKYKITDYQENGLTRKELESELEKRFA